MKRAKRQELAQKNHEIKELIKQHDNKKSNIENTTSRIRTKQQDIP